MKTNDDGTVTVQGGEAVGSDGKPSIQQAVDPATMTNSTGQTLLQHQQAVRDQQQEVERAALQTMVDRARDYPEAALAGPTFLPVVATEGACNAVVRVLEAVRTIRTHAERRGGETVLVARCMAQESVLRDAVERLAEVERWA